MHFERPTSQKPDFPVAKRIAFLGITALIGLMTGAIGFALALRWYGDAFGPMLFGANRGLSIGRSLLSIEQPLMSLAAPLEESVVSIRRARVNPSAPVRIVDTALHVGSGALITSDGWIVTSHLPSAEAAYEVAVGGQAYQVERAIADPYTGLFFLKTTLRDVRPVDLHDESLAYGESAIRGARDSSGGFVLSATLISQPLYQSFVSASEAVHSTTALGEFVQLQEMEADGLYFNLRGQLIGLPAGKPARMVSSRHVKLSFEQLLRNQKDTDLGVTFVDVELTAGRKAALLYHPTRNAVRSGSLAQRAGLVSGDTVVSVNGVPIDSSTPLTYLWRKFQHQEMIQFQVLRGGRELTLELEQKN